MVGAAAALALSSGCDTLREKTQSTTGTTMAPLPTVTTSTVPATTTSAPNTTAAAVSTTLAPQPVGDWDGARFDFGRITGTGETADGLYRTITLDRYSFRHPTLGLVDAAGFSEEPVTYWWRDEPWENNNPARRELVLAPNVQLLALSPDGDDTACGEPAPAEPPTPTWIGVDPSYLRTNAARTSIAVIAYAPTGPVATIRFTHGC